MGSTMRNANFIAIFSTKTVSRTTAGKHDGEFLTCHEKDFVLHPAQVKSNVIDNHGVYHDKGHGDGKEDGLQSCFWHKVSFLSGKTMCCSQSYDRRFQPYKGLLQVFCARLPRILNGVDDFVCSFSFSPSYEKNL